MSVATHSAQAEVRASALKVYTVKFKAVNGGKKTFLLISKSGRTLASAKVKKGAVELKTKGENKVSSIEGATIQIVSSNGGVYYGPVVLGWKKTPGNKTFSEATRIYTKFKASSNRNPLNLGTITVTNVRVNGKQGYGKPATSSLFADTSPAAEVFALAGKPIGVGRYGKDRIARSQVGVFAAEVGIQVSDLPEDNTLGGDKDDDGLPNAFDVNDDGDRKIDSSDADTPRLEAVVETPTGVACAPIEFKIFTIIIKLDLCKTMIPFI